MYKMINKRGKAWVWILVIVLILIVAGIITYVALSGDVNPISGGGSIPQPPPLPQ